MSAEPEPELEPEPEPEPPPPPPTVDVLLVKCVPSNKRLLAFLRRQEAEELWGSTTFEVMQNSQHVDATAVQLVCTPELTVLAARQQLSAALNGAAEVEQIPRRWGGADLADDSLLADAPVMQLTAAARLVLPVLLSAEVPFVVHPAPPPRAEASAEEAAAIDTLFLTAERVGVAVDGKVAASELLKLVEDPADELKAFVADWSRLLAAEQDATATAAGGEEDSETEAAGLLSKRAFVAMREQDIAAAEAQAKAAPEVGAEAEVQTAEVATG
jgi:hypothetical protein